MVSRKEEKKLLSNTYINFGFDVPEGVCVTIKCIYSMENVHHFNIWNLIANIKEVFAEYFASCTRECLIYLYNQLIQ